MSDNIYTAVNTGSTPEEARANVAEGLQTMATGAMEVFSALYDLLDLSSRANKVEPDDITPTDAAADTTVPVNTPETPAQPGKQESDDQPDGPGHSVPEKTAPEKTVSEKPAVTTDEITKAAVALIKRDRKNSVKIQALLKTYGVSQMSSLQPDKYEAFMRDLDELGKA